MNLPELKTFRGLAVLLILLMPFAPASGQMASVSVNVVDLAELGTMNANFSITTSRHLSLEAGFRYNPWTFSKDGHQMQNRVRGASAGVRWWFWYVYSGWWAGVQARLEEYNRGGIVSSSTEEGLAHGTALSGGYSLMLRRNLNLDLGGGMWAGFKECKTYSCPTCGRLVDSGNTFFLVPSDFRVALMLTF